LILYVNGDSHSAGAEAVNSFAFANDDPQYKHLGRLPHPDNLFVSYGNILAQNLSAELHCDAESASSNDRIIRTTRQYLQNYKPDFIVIGWSTWEREEWLHENQYWQINAGGIGHDWPEIFQNKYKTWINDIDLKQKKKQAQEKIYELHTELADIPHLFFNSYSPLDNDNEINWKNNYLSPYDINHTFFNWLNNQGFKTVNPKSYHFGPDAHQIWSKHLTKIIKESIMVK